MRAAKHVNEVADGDQQADQDDERERKQEAAVRREVRRAQNVTDIATQGSAEDDVDEVDAAIELALFLSEVALPHHHFSGRWVNPARSSMARLAFSTICSS